MSYLSETFKIDSKPRAKDENVVLVKNARFTVITSRIIRMEYNDKNYFEDRASQCFWYREQPSVNFTSKVDDDKI